MAFFLTLALWVGTFVLSQLLTPDPEIEHARPASLNDFDFPTATEGRVIPLQWGTDLIKGPNVIWYGDYRAYPIKKKIHGGLFHSDKYMITGWQYYIGFQMGICQGPAVLKAIYVGENLVWQGTQATDGEIELNKYGVKGTFQFYTGSTTQSQDPYLATHQSPCPAYRGLCYGVWKGGYVGTSTRILPWSFEVQRIPTGLTAGAYSAVNIFDCNPMELMYEVFTNTEWGDGYSTSEIDTADWITAAITLFNEGNGISLVLANQTSIVNIRKEVEKQINGHFRVDPETGKWKCVLIRGGYSTSGLKVANESTVVEMIELSRGSWEGTINSIRIQYKRRSNDYTDGFAQAQDAANMQVQARRVPAIYSYVGIRDDSLANKIAWRELRESSYPLAKARFKADRSFWDSYRGEVFLLTYTFKKFSVADIPFRITKIDFGSMDDPHILIDAVQDIFSWRAASFSDADISQWNVPDTGLTPFPATDQFAFELPYAIQRRQDDSSEGQIFVAGESQGREEAGFELLHRSAASYPVSGNYTSAGTVSSVIWTGFLDGDVDQDDTQIDVMTDANSVDAGFLLSILPEIGVGEYLLNLFMIGDELIACSGVSIITGGLRFTGCLRGLCDTAQAVHTDGDKVWFLSTKNDVPTIFFENDYYVDMKLLPYDQFGNQIAENDPGITILELKLDYRPRRPYPPTFMEWNSSGYPTSVDITSDVVVTFNRRDYRIFNEESQHSTDASTINGDFPANNNTKYRLKLWEGSTLKYTGDWNAGAATVTMTLEKILRYLDGLPTSLTMSLDTKHTYNSVDYDSTQEVFHTASVQASSFDDDHWFGVCSPSTACPYTWTNVPDSGTYAFSIGTATLSGDVEARINGGSWQQVIVAGNSSGNLTGVTAGDNIDVRHLDSSSSDEILLTVDSPTSSENGFGILIFA